MKANGQFKECEICRKIIYFSPNRLKKNKHFSCSKACAGTISSLEYVKKRVIRQCVVCLKNISYKASAAKKITSPTCSANCTARWRSYTYSGCNNPKSLSLNTEERFWWNKCIDLRSRALKKNLPFDLDYKFLQSLFINQDGKCYYSDLPMIMSSMGKGSADYNVLSVDRIDSSKGYVRDNTVLCINSINMLKAGHDLNNIKKVFDAIRIKEEKRIITKIKKIYPSSQFDYRHDNSNAGHDLYTHHVEDCGEYIKIFTGVSVELPKGYFFILVPRSSAHNNGILLYNNIGIIDNSFRGEIIALFLKTPQYNLPEIGTRLVQIVLQKQIFIKCIEVDNLSETDRGVGGFGSTGK